MKVMSFNLRCPVPHDGAHYWPHRIDAVTQVIQEHQPDILGVQEETDQMMDDLCALHFRYIALGTGRNADLKGERTTLYINSQRLIVHSQQTEWLSPEPALPGSMVADEGFPRIVTWAHLEDRETHRHLRVYNTHFAYRSHQAQFENIEALLRIIARHDHEQPLPSILMGDFNTTPDHSVHVQLRQQGWSDQRIGTPDEHTKTFHAFKGLPGDSLIDFIYLRGALRGSSFQVDTRQVNQLYPSDHFPLIAEVTYE